MDRATHGQREQRAESHHRFVCRHKCNQAAGSTAARQGRGALNNHGRQSRRSRDRRLAAKERGDGDGARSHAAAPQHFPQAIERAIGAAARRIVGQPQDRADFAKGTLFIKTQEDHLPVTRLQVLEGTVEQRAQLRPIIRVTRGFIHGPSLLFARLAALFAAHQGGRCGAWPDRATPPNSMPGKGPGLPRQIGKDLLGHVLGLVDVAVQLAQGRAID